MRAAVMDQPGVVTVRDVPPPTRGGLALVRVAQAGICGTDLKIAAGDIPVVVPRVIGHEMTGWVESPGRRENVPAGTSVLVNPAVFCGACDLCRRDLPQLCRGGALLGRDVDGCFADFVAVDEACLHPIPASVSAAESALLQVLSTCVHVQLLRARGVETIVGITRSGWKRELALRFGASHAAAPEDAQQAVADATGG